MSKTMPSGKPHDAKKSGCCGGKSNAGEPETDRTQPQPRPEKDRSTGGGCCGGSGH